MSITLICKTCGKQFSVFPSAIKRYATGVPRKYCCYACAVADPERMAHRRVKPEIKTCKHCGKEYEYRKGENGKYFCSPDCDYASRGDGSKRQPETILTFACSFCGKITERPSAWNKGYKNLYCSKECHYEHRIQTYAAEWGDRDRQNRGPNWHRQRNKARKRDSYTCQHCGITEKQLGYGLDVHHITPFRTFKGDWRKANELTNLISLCRNCHRKVEYTPNQITV